MPCELVCSQGSIGHTSQLPAELVAEHQEARERLNVIVHDPYCILQLARDPIGEVFWLKTGALSRDTEGACAKAIPRALFLSGGADANRQSHLARWFGGRFRSHLGPREMGSQGSPGLDLHQT